LGILHIILTLSARVSTSRRWDIRVSSDSERISSLSLSYAEPFQDHDLQHPVVINTKIDGRDAYATSDLLEPHPTKSGLWKIYGRKDDQIMLSTGEKTNPGPLGKTTDSISMLPILTCHLEGILAQDPHILSAVMFGRGRFQNGVLIDPKPQFAFDPKDEAKLETFRKLIWQVYVSPCPFSGS
jgi:hypothetical protein